MTQPNLPPVSRCPLEYLPTMGDINGSGADSAFLTPLHLLDSTFRLLTPPAPGP